MCIDVQLFILCENFINELHVLKEEGLVTNEEFHDMVKWKLKFVEEHKDKVCIQS